MTNPQAIAAEILKARQGGRHLDARVIAAGADDAASAYAIQRLVAEEAAATLGPVAGYKIGIATAAAQRQNGLSEAVMGRIYRDRIYPGGVRLELAADRRIGLEVEIGVRLASAVDAEAGPADPVAVRAAIASYHPAIELLEDRFLDMAAAPLWALAADDMLGMGAVIGEAIAGFDPQDAHAGTLRIDDDERARGNSADLAGGGPLSGIGWLAYRLEGQGRGLAGGDVVLSGGLNAPIWLEPKPGASTLIEARLDGDAVVTLTIDWTG